MSKFSRIINYDDTKPRSAFTDDDDDEEELLTNPSSVAPEVYAEMKKAPVSKFLVCFSLFILFTLLLSAVYKVDDKKEPGTPPLSVQTPPPLFDDDNSQSQPILVPELDPGGNPTLQNGDQPDVIHQGESMPMDMDFHQTYHSSDEILEFFTRRAKTSSVFVDIKVLGQTEEHRDIIGVQVGQGGQSAMWLNCGFHAREWIAPATCLYIYDFLLYDKSNRTQHALETTTFYFTPFANPDGYEYSRLKDRDWRKTRQTIKGSRCKGIDLDRNWPYKYELQVDISKEPCTENYGGLTALSALENQYIKTYIENKPNIGVALDIHSYGLELGSPFGWTRNAPEYNGDIQAAGKHAAEAIRRVHGKSYKVGQAGKLIYKTSGIASDWAYAELGAVCSFTAEVRGSIRERFEFKLPENQIVPNGEEFTEGVFSFVSDLQSGLCRNFKA